MMSIILVALALLEDSPAAERCVATARDVAAGEHVTRDALQSVPCQAGSVPNGRLSFDPATQSAIAAEALPVGTYLGALWADGSAILPKGSRVTLRAISGPAIIEREVITLQPARSGQRVFVRDASGNVFAAPLLISERDR